MLPQKKFRELVFQMIYSREFGEEMDPSLLLMDQLHVTKKTVRLAQERVDHIYQHIQAIDEKIVAAVNSYDFQRITYVERNVLRLGIFEILFDDSIPPKVAIVEGVRLARKFGTPGGGRFVNAVLDHVHSGEPLHEPLVLATEE